MKIADVKARQVFDSRANATVEVDVTLEDGTVGRGTVPSGASTGIYGVLELRDGVKSGALNAVLVKMNQIGTITETIDAIEFTKNSGYLPVISARSGETEDSTIVHLSIATNAGQLKVGSVARTERAIKWNETIRMEELLGKNGYYPGASIFDSIKK